MESNSRIAHRIGRTRSSKLGTCQTFKIWSKAYTCTEKESQDGVDRHHWMIFMAKFDHTACLTLSLRKSSSITPDTNNSGWFRNSQSQSKGRLMPQSARKISYKYAPAEDPRWGLRRHNRVGEIVSFHQDSIDEAYRSSLGTHPSSLPHQGRTLRTSSNFIIRSLWSNLLYTDGDPEPQGFEY